MQVTKIGYVEWFIRAICPECGNEYLLVYRGMGICPGCYVVFVVEEE